MYHLRNIVIAVGVALLSVATSYSQSRPTGQAAQQQLRWLLKQPTLRLSTEGVGEQKEFHFSVAMASGVPGGSEPGKVIRFLVHKNGDKVGVLLLNGKGAPYAYLGDEVCFRIDPTHPGRVVVSDGGKVRFVIADNPKTQQQVCEVRVDPSAKDNVVVVDFKPSMSEVVSSSYDHSRRLLVMSSKRARLSIMLDGRTGRFPIRQWMLENPNGPSLTFNRVGLRGGPVRKVIGITVDTLKKAGLSTTTVSPTDFNAGLTAIPSRFPESAKELKAAQSLMSIFGVDEAAIARKERDVAGFLLTNLLASLGSEGRPDEAQLRKIRVLLDTGILARLTIPGNGSRMNWVYDHEKTVAALRGMLGNDMGALYDLLAAGCLDSGSPEHDRLLCLNILGDVGIPKGSDILKKIGAAVKNDDRLSPALAAVRVRGGAANKDDADTLLAAVRDKETPLPIRLMAIEGAAILDRLVGDDLDIALRTISEFTTSGTDTQSPDGGSQRHAMTRYCYSLGYGTNGRKGLLKRIQQPSSAMPRDYLLASLRNYLKADDPLMPEIIKVGEAMALSKESDVETKLIGMSMLSPAGHMAVEQRVRVIKHFVDSGDEVLMTKALLYIGLPPTHPCGNAGPLSFLPEIAIACKSKSTKVRREAFVTLSLNLTKVKIDAQHNPVSLLVAGLRDSDEGVRRGAQLAVVRLVKWGELACAKNSDQLIAPLVSAMVPETDVKTVMTVAAALEELTKGAFRTPGEPPRDGGGYLVNDEQWWQANAGAVKEAAAKYNNGRGKTSSRDSSK